MRKSSTEKARAGKKKEISAIAKDNVEDALIFDEIKPMLALLSAHSINEAGYLYELKWDGFRAIAQIHQHNVNIKSRNDKSFNDKFYPLISSLSTLDHDLILDGEIVVLDDHGYPDFAALQTWRSEADGTLVFYLFDILYKDGISLMNVPLIERKKILDQVKLTSSQLRKSEYIVDKGDELFELASNLKLEGIIAKKKDSLYQSGQRSADWLKIKTQKHQEVIIGGLTKNEGTARKFSALLVGNYRNGSFEFTGTVGTGFTNAMQQKIVDVLEPYFIRECPFSTVPEFNKPSRFRPKPVKATVQWVSPKVVAEIVFKTVSSDGNLRHPSFRGLREDKRIEDINDETTTQTNSNAPKEETVLHNMVI